MHDFPPIGEHGLIGDLQTCALVATDGTIDWFCWPRFDSPSMFASLLDRGNGGYFRIAPEQPGYVSRQLYLPGTAVLITRFMTSDGVGELADFMPVVLGEATNRHRIVRVLRVVRGRMRFVVECQPRFDYGRGTHKTEILANGVAFHAADGAEVVLHIARRPNVAAADAVQPEYAGDGVQGVIALDAGEVGGVILESAPPGAPREVLPGEIVELFDDTRDFWRGWIGRSRYAGRWREAVERSAMTLKLLTYAPTGAPIAAPTLGLPEQPGGERNWDYRYTWVRDGSFSVNALLRLGYTEEAHAFLRWLGDRLQTTTSDEHVPPLKIMYRVDGSSDLAESALDHLAGWRNSQPVRVGNGASDQLQLDIYGEAMDALSLGDAHGLPLTHEAWQKTRQVIEWVCDNWDRPDEGIWETRGGQQHFTYGRLMSWVALDRAIRLAYTHARPADLDRWTTTRDAIYDQIMTRGWNVERSAFVQHYATDVLDASLLYMPLVGFVAPQDPRWQTTLRAMEDELVSDSLVYRYDPSASPDGLRGAEGTFSICTFWYVEALARSGRLDDARLTFEKMLTYTNHVGLFAEEIGPTGEQLGNFPQAFSHLALINAATTLDDEMREGHPASDAAGSQMKDKEYQHELRRLHGELVAMQEWVKTSGAKVCIVFEGRDTAGKGGTIKAITERVSPRVFRIVALPAPTAREKSQMYIQRYVPHFPAAGEVVIFDRSWYNRAGVERVMGFCTENDARRFLDMTPAVEKAMIDDGILLVKYWLEVSADEQTRRLESRIDDPRKIWKLSDMDLKSYARWDDYSRARDEMFAATGTPWAPWYVAHSDDKKRARLNVITHLLGIIPYEPLRHKKVTLPNREITDRARLPDAGPPAQEIPTPF